MDPSEEKKTSQQERQKKSYLIPAIVALLILACTAGAFLYLQPGKKTDTLPEAINETTPLSSEFKEQNPPPPPIPLQNTEPTGPSEKATEQNVPENVSKPENNVVSQAPVIPQTAEVAPLTEQPPVVKDTAGCLQATERITDFYTILDSRTYIKAYHVSPSSREHFTALIKKLLTNPPKVTGETDDLYTILRNTAHFFRITGKDNVLMMKGVLNSERKSLEGLMADYYTLLSSPDCSTSPYVADLNRDGLYEYACFFLNTMGGRLYLFRRDSLSRMVVTYYAILLVEQANEQNRNSHGIALKPVVNMLISEMETGGSALQHADMYLDRLYDLKEKYQ